MNAVKKLKELKKQFEVWNFRNSLSKLLRKEAGEENIRHMDDFLDEISR